MALTAGDIEIFQENVPDQHFQEWASVMSEILKYKECSVLVGKIFFDYLRPEVPELKVPQFNIPEGLEEADLEDYLFESRKAWFKNWLSIRMDIRYLFYMYTSIMYPEDWLKKNSKKMLTKMFPNRIQQSSKDTSQKSSMLSLVPSQPGLPFEFDSQ